MIPYREKDGWQLYYSEEGHPYYYNALTGQSDWATHDSYFESINGDIQESPTRRNVNEETVQVAEDNVEENEEDEDDEKYDGEDEDNDDEESGASSFDEAFDRKFKQYLQTAEGIAAVLNEQERIAKFIEKEENRKAEKRDYQYLKSLISSKKSDDSNSTSINHTGQSSSLFQNIVGSALSWLSTSSESPNKTTAPTNNKAKRNRNNHNFTSTFNSDGRVLDDFGRETKQRGGGSGSSNKRVNSDNPTDIEIDPETGSSHDNNSTSRSISRSNSSSEIESLSSEDSDVATIKAPMFAELPPWLTWSFYNDRYFTPMYEYFEEQGVTATVSASARRTLQIGTSTVSFIAYQTWLLAMQAAIIGGEYSYVLVTGIFERLRPYLVEFMEQVVDRNTTQQGAVANNRVLVNTTNRFNGVGDGRHPPTSSPPPPFAEPRDHTPIYTGDTVHIHVKPMPPMYVESSSTVKTSLVADNETMQALALGIDVEEESQDGEVLPRQAVEQENKLDQEIV